MTAPVPAVTAARAADKSTVWLAIEAAVYDNRDHVKRQEAWAALDRLVAEAEQAGRERDEARRRADWLFQDCEAKYGQIIAAESSVAALADALRLCRELLADLLRHELTRPGARGQMIPGSQYEARLGNLLDDVDTALAAAGVAPAAQMDSPESFPDRKAASE